METGYRVCVGAVVVPCVLLVFRLVVVCRQILSGYSDGTVRATGVSIGCCVSSDTVWVQ